MQECITSIDQWLFFIKNAHMYHDIPQKMKNSEEFTQAFATLEQSRWSQAEMIAYMRDRDFETREDRIKLAYFQEGAQKKLKKLP